MTTRYDSNMAGAGTLRTDTFAAGFEFAQSLDRADPLRAYRDRFAIPKGDDGDDLIYLTGNSLGLQPTEARRIVDAEMDAWARQAVDAHFKTDGPWYTYHELVRDPLARLMGAKPEEVVAMNSLTVNLHLMMVSFYRPTPNRHRILIDWPAFPSDLYAVQTQARHHGFDPDEAILRAEPRAGEHTLRMDDVEALINRQGDSIALILFSGVNYFTGQWMDMKRIAAAGHANGCMVGFDLAHAAGNVPVQLRESGADFAAWCSYKYLNSGPGAVAGCFVSERHTKNVDLPRFGGWWGNDPETRFQMHGIEKFVPRASADGWQLSNPPILSLAPMRASLAVIDEAGIERLRAKSLRLTAYLRWLLEQQEAGWYEVITPREDAAHGCQLSILVHDRPRERFETLQRAGVVCDFREPNVIRAAPVPLFNSFVDVWRFAETLGSIGE